MDTDTNYSENEDFPIVSEQIESVGKSSIGYIRNHIGYVYAFIGIFFVWCAILIMLQVNILQAYFIPLIIVFPAYYYIQDKIQHEFMRQFAAANGYTYSARGTLDDLDGALFRIGHSKSVTDVAKGTYHGLPTELFLYIYKTGQGKNSETYDYTIFKFHLNANMPDIILENTDILYGQPITQHTSEKVILELEGDFNKYFTLSVAKDYEIEALQVFTPDIMVDLEDKCKHLNLEIVNSHLFIYKNEFVQTKKDLYALYDCAKYFEEKLAPVLARMKPALDDTAAMPKE